MIWKLRKNLETKIARYIALTISVLSAFLLTTFKLAGYQVLGWCLAVISSTMWAYWGWNSTKQEGYGRFIMEVLYVLLGMWGVYNWYG